MKNNGFQDMAFKVEIKQECGVSENEGHLLSKDFAVATVNNDCKLESMVKIKVEDPFLDLKSQNEEEAFSKEFTHASDFYSNIERRNCSKDCVIKVEKFDNKGDTQIQIKEEALWSESSSVYNVIQDEINEHFPPVESPRSFLEADSGDSSEEPPILSDQGIPFKDDSEFENCSNWKGHRTKAASIIKDNHSKKPWHVPSSLKQDSSIQHNNEKYKNLKNKLYKCDVCEKSYTKPSSLKRHSMIHQGKMPYKCDICGKNFRDLWNLSRHSFIHEGQKPYRCDVCEKEFAVRSSLKRHHLIHEGKKPHKCNICKKAFIDFSHLKRHNYLIHESKNSHKCNICDKTFTYLSNLKTHYLIHEDKRPYKCSICEKGFAHLLGLKTHNHKIHVKKKSGHIQHT